VRYIHRRSAHVKVRGDPSRKQCRSASDGRDAERNYAASGGSQQRIYPWSSPATSDAIECRNSNFQNGGIACFNNVPVEVGTLAGGARWGQQDLSGNVEEFTLDLDSGDLPNTCANCAARASGIFYVMRGGSYESSYEYVRSVAKGASMNFREADNGFRCARVP
jgi:formylglycine-generating enzyme